MLLNKYPSAAVAVPSRKGEYRALLYAALGLFLLLCAGFAFANQTNSSTSGTGPVVKTYPATLTATYTIGGPQTVVGNANTALNAIGGVTSAQLSPSILATTNATQVNVDTAGCAVATLRCSNLGTLTIAFNRAVTNPVLHISGLGGNLGTTTTMYHTSLNLTSWTATGTPTLTSTAANANFTVTSNEIRATTVNGGTSCTAGTAAGCGSVRINGTVSSVTFRLDALMGGTTNSVVGNIDAFNITTSVDEDFGDAPNSYQASPVASHIVGGLYLGASVTADNVAVTNSGALATSPIANATASSDGGDDGVTASTLVRGVASDINVAVTGTGGLLQGWIDWAADGSFATAGDQIATNAVDGGAGDTDGIVNGIIRLSVTPPAGTTQTTVTARFRISTTANLGINGNAPDGEVEDYQAIVYPQRNDLSITKTVSNAAPAPGAAISYTLTLTSAAFAPATSNTTTTGVTVQDTLPAGFVFSSVVAGGTGTYNNGTGVWTVGSLAPGQVASITINGTATNTAATTVTNVAQVSASSVTDPDSTPNNGVTTEDDYASVNFTTATVFNCPMGSTATGSGYTTGGTGQYQNQIFWLDWSCSGTTNFPAGAVINKSWNAGDGLVITGQVSNITGGTLSSYVTGSWTGDLLDNMYPGVNPVGLGGGSPSNDPSFRTTYTATLNGVPVSLRYVIADAETTDAGSESLSSTTNGSPWQLVEKQGSISETLSGTNASWTGGGGGSGSIVIETSGVSVQLNNSMVNNGGEYFAFGVFTPFDYSDAPLTGTSYGAANHRTVAGLRMGASFTTENAAFDSPTASADADDAVAYPSLLQNQVATVNVPVTGPGYLSAWADWNDDGDFADAGEKYASDVVDGGAGDADATVNGVIALSVTPPATAATTPTIGRFRFSSRTGAPISGLYGFGEVEDYPLTVMQPRLDVTKTSSIISDGVSGSNPKSLPGAVVRYCILMTNNGSAPATNISATDVLPTNVTYIAGSMLSGTSCAAAATAEDDNAAGADESDPFGMSITGTTITGVGATLGIGSSYAMVFRATVN